MVAIALAEPGDRVRRIAAIAITCVYLLHILVAFGMYVATIVIPVVRTDSLVLSLALTISIAFPFVELIGVVMALDWRGGRVFWQPSNGERD